jgi:hypothetical protein
MKLLKNRHVCFGVKKLTRLEWPLLTKADVHP